MTRVVVIGGGAAGMMAAIAAARSGGQVLLLEKNEKLGKKLFITGKGRCNLTNACDTQELFSCVTTNHKFLYSAISGFNNWQTYAFFEELGLPLKIERGGRVFPESDHSSDVIRTLERELRRLGVTIRLRTEVRQILMEDGRAVGVLARRQTTEGEGGKRVQTGHTEGKERQDGRRDAGREERIPADAVILTTGGCSYPSTGSTGDGYRLAAALGHTIHAPEPSLTPLETAEDWCRSLMGLTLKNIRIRLQDGSTCLYEGFGELLFTHFGVSGPLILSASARLGGYLEYPETQVEGKQAEKTHTSEVWRPASFRERVPLRKPLELIIDLKPALTEEQLDGRIQRDFLRYQNRKLLNAMDDLLPKKLIPVVIAVSGMSPEHRVNTLTREERACLVRTLKCLPLQITACRGFREAIVTRGGVAVTEIQPKTMESRLVGGLYIAGETLDADALTGGFNLQIAWSTGYAAGTAAGLTFS